MDLIYIYGRRNSAGVDWKDGADGWVQWGKVDKVGWKQTEGVTGYTASMALDDIERYLLDY